MSADDQCFFCNTPCRVDVIAALSGTSRYSCRYCGEYLLDPLDSATLSSEHDSKFKLACVLNERRLKGLGGVALSDKTNKERKVCGYPEVSIEDVLDEFPKKASEFFSRTLLSLSRLPKRPFETIKLDMNGDYLHLFTPSKDAAYVFLRELAGQGFVRFNEVTGGPQWNVFSLTTKFWEMVEDLQRAQVGNKRAFVAMWFDQSMNDSYMRGIKKAIEQAGYEPIRIDMQDFNEKICDEIIAGIRRSKFLVADFSGLRSGVFYEAGFAKGLGREVIFVVRKSDVDVLKEHFDTRQYNHIVYDSPEELHNKLYSRICATIV